MLKKPDDDLFKDSTMTFGEHLEELRVCLWKATLGLYRREQAHILYTSE